MFVIQAKRRKLFLCHIYDIRALYFSHIHKSYG